MASVVLGVAGAAIGAVVPGASPAMGYMIGSAVGNALFPEKGKDGPRIGALNIQDSSYGGPIPIIYGSYRCAGNIIWATKLIPHFNETDSGSGGGGVTDYTYTCSFAVGICAGPIFAISRIWADGKLIYNKLRGYVGKQAMFSATSFKIYTGTETQLPDPVMEGLQGVGNVPAYRGMAYIVFEDLVLGKYGNRVPSFTFEVLMRGKNFGNDAPVTLGNGGNMAQDPINGWIYVVNDSTGAVDVYDPVTLEVVASLPLPHTQFFSPMSIVYDWVHQQMYIGNGSPNIAGYTGWTIDTNTGAVAVINIGSDTPFAAGAYWWPGVITQEGVAFGVNGFGGGNGWEIADPALTKPQQAASVPGYASQVFASPDRTTQVVTSFRTGYWLGVDLIVMAVGVTGSGYFFRLEVINEEWKAIGYSAGGAMIQFDDRRHYLYWACGSYPNVYKMNRFTGELTMVIETAAPTAILYSPDTDTLYVANGAGFFDYFQSYSVTDNGLFTKNEEYPENRMWSIQAGGSNDNSVYIGNESFLVSNNGILKVVSFAHSVLPEKVQLMEIVADISLRCKLKERQFDVEQLIDMVTGYCITNQMTGRSAIEPLMPAYSFDAVESDRMMKFPKRGSPPMLTVPLSQTLMEDK